MGRQKMHEVLTAPGMQELVSNNVIRDPSRLEWKAQKASSSSFLGAERLKFVPFNREMLDSKANVFVSRANLSICSLPIFLTRAAWCRTLRVSYSSFSGYTYGIQCPRTFVKNLCARSLVLRIVTIAKNHASTSPRRTRTPHYIMPL